MRTTHVIRGDEWLSSMLLMHIADKVGATGLQEFLLENAASREGVDGNTWQAAMYRALPASSWFCSEGFRQI